MTRSERRYTDLTKALRKRNITRKCYCTFSGHEYYDNLHQYSKNKIHCSCPMCSGISKTNRKKQKGKGYGLRLYNVSYGTTNHRNRKNYKISDLIKIERLYDEEKLWLEN